MELKLYVASALLLTSSVVCSDTVVPPPYSDMEGKPLSTVECMAVNLYHEARSQSDLANINVIAVMLNRVEDSRFPDSVCEVVFQKAQFSWTNDQLSDKITDTYQYRRLYRLAEQALINKEFVQSVSGGVTHYH
ncbi:MAG: cell wall hydrolase, partial [Colwellia sp.]|nr:cell wall hydrolase [Colwellia sp.]